MSSRGGPRWRLVAGVMPIALVLVAIGVGLALGAGGGSAPVAEVVAGENPWGNVAAQLSGGLFHVDSILSNPNADPHIYESDAADAAEVAHARLLISNGLGYDDFMAKLAAASPSSARRSLVAATVVGATGPETNPHLWYSVGDVEEMARAITAAYVELAPDRRGLLEDRLSAFLASLGPWRDAIAELRRDDPGAPVAYTERVPGYLVEAAGLWNRTPTAFATAVEDGTEPSPAATAQMTALIDERGIDALLYNVQATARATTVVRALALAHHVPVVSVSETLPAHDTTLQQWQTDQANALLKALARR